jgi:hypothetical protein
VHRRAYLVATTTGLGTAVAGCLGGGGGLDQAEVERIDGWFQVAVDLIDEGQRRTAGWLDEPASANLDAMASLESDAETLSTQWSQEVEPKLDGLGNTDIDRTVGNESWQVEGSAFVDVLEDLHRAVDAVQTAAGAVVAAEGDPDQVGSDALATVERLAEESRATVDEALDLWFRDALDG